MPHDRGGTQISSLWERVRMIAESRTNDVIIVRTGVEHGIAFREWGRCPHSCGGRVVSILSGDWPA
jgi:hypothetical protein